MGGKLFCVVKFQHATTKLSFLQLPSITWYILSNRKVTCDNGIFGGYNKELTFYEVTYCPPFLWCYVREIKNEINQLLHMSRRMGRYK
jgi:hypothetical protein